MAYGKRFTVFFCTTNVYHFFTSEKNGKENKKKEENEWNYKKQQNIKRKKNIQNTQSLWRKWNRVQLNRWRMKPSHIFTIIQPICLKYWYEEWLQMDEKICDIRDPLLEHGCMGRVYLFHVKHIFNWENAFC